jgi:hypothetical protein
VHPLPGSGAENSQFQRESFESSPCRNSGDLESVSGKLPNFVVSPEVGAVRGNSVNVSPKVITTYTLYATNEFGTATVIVTVQYEDLREASYFLLQRVLPRTVFRCPSLPICITRRFEGQ